MEVLRQEVVTVRLVVVRSDVKFLRLGTAFHFDFASFALLLAENGGVVKAPPLRFHLHPKQTLGALNQGTIQRHADVSRLDVFQDVVLLALEADVHLVFKIEQRLRVVLGAKLNLVADFSRDV